MSAVCEKETPFANPCEYCEYAEEREDPISGNTYLACSRDTMEVDYVKH